MKTLIRGAELSMRLNEIESVESHVNFSLLKNQKVFQVCLADSYIASGKYIGPYLIEASVLDGSEIIESMRVMEEIGFAIEIQSSERIHGLARVSISGKGILEGQKNVLHVQLELKRAMLEPSKTIRLFWQT